MIKYHLIAAVRSERKKGQPPSGRETVFSSRPPPSPVGWAVRASREMATPLSFSYKYHNGCSQGGVT